MKVLVVDDSVVFRTQITNALSAVPDIEVVGTAPNGRIALQRLSQLSVDLITLDMEMPEMDGIETLKAIRSQNIPVKIIIFSSQTLRGAERALEALNLGADDVVAKPSGDNFNFEKALSSVREVLLPKVLQFSDKKISQPIIENQIIPKTEFQSYNTTPIAKNRTYEKKSFQMMFPKVVVIASSTGGPTALETIFSKIPGPYQIPVLIAQHMPPVFTQILARRLSEITGVKALEAIDGEDIQNNQMYIAPGDFHLRINKLNTVYKIQISKEEQRNSVRPAADFLFESAAKFYGDSCIGIVLTGMGEDGCDGAKAIKGADGGILIQ